MTTQNQLEAIMAQGKILPDSKITEIFDELQNKQPSVYRFIYGGPSDTINLLNSDMANLYLDLSFDVVWFFRNKFGKIPAKCTRTAKKCTARASLCSFWLPVICGATNLKKQERGECGTIRTHRSH